MMNTNEPKVLRDPIHGYIHVNLQVVWDCINSKEMQRLRRIRQLGGDFQVYHTAEHSRFSHSLGVYEIVRRMVTEIESLRNRLCDFDKTAVMLAGLLHDIGHGPFSHAFESISKVHHEDYTVQIILGNSDVHDILMNVNGQLSDTIASIILYKHPVECVNQLLSGQLDADRMDYLLRDAYFTGTSYGTFDLERILRTVRLQGDRMVVKQSGIHSVEDYIMARYHMYWQVYLHPIARSYETILSLALQRMHDIYHTNPDKVKQAEMFFPFFQNHAADIHALHKLDESAAQYGIACMIDVDDDILRDLCYRLMNRVLFDYIPLHKQADYDQICAHVISLGYDPAYFVHHDCVNQLPYSLYTGQDAHNIWVLCEDGSIQELSTVSMIVQALANAELKEEAMLYFPEKKITIL